MKRDYPPVSPRQRALVRASERQKTAPTGQFPGQFSPHTDKNSSPARILTALDCERHHSGILLDARCPGLRLVATPGAGAGGAPRRSWIYRYRRRDGTRGQIKLGEYPRMSLANARDAWDEQKTVRDDPSLGDPRAARRAAIAAEAAKRTRAYTVRELLEDYFKLHAARLARGAEQERMLRFDVLPAWGARAAHEISAREAVDLVERIAARAPRVAIMVASALRQAFALAIARRRLDGINPLAGVSLGQARARTRALDNAELAALLAWLPKGKLSANVRDALRLTLLTAARSGEVVGADWREIDLEAAIWSQPAAKTKNGRPHRVMLSRQAVALLAARRRDHPQGRWVFPSRDHRPLKQKAVGFAQYEVREACPVKDWTVHDLRRSALTGLARLGCPRVVQDRIANHVDRGIAAIYDVHSYDEEARAWLQAWANHLDALAIP